uniref:Myocardin related transcription factor A n=1 Tax=Oryctolagus cuniculus TaxID=9986 RepID=G1U0K0_RABIT
RPPPAPEACTRHLRTEDYLKRKIRSRPERSELVRMHILEETSAEPSLQAKQLKLKRARLADDLNEKIAQRPGPMELVEKNILPVESSLKEAIIVGQVNYPKVADSSSFDEDSSDALSPEQPASHDSQGSVPSPLEARASEPLPSATSMSPAQVLSQLPVGPDSGETLFLGEQPPLPPPPLLPPSLTNGSTAPTAKPPPTLIKVQLPAGAPPHGEGGVHVVPQESGPAEVTKMTWPAALPANLDDMKVAELKQELKLRSLPVSGTKTELIERLRAHHDQPSPAPGLPKAPAAASLLSKAGEVVVAFPAARLSTGPALVAAGLAPAEVVVATVTGSGVVKFGSTGSTPPVSPTPSERSLLSTGDENSTPGDTFGEMVTSPLTQLTLQASPLQVLVKEEGPRGAPCCRSPGARDKDQMLQEKDKQIEELTRMLRQKQQLVELLRLQLEQEKRAQQAAPAPVKQESSFASCQLGCPALGPAHPFSPSLAASAADPADAQVSAPGPPAVVVKQEAAQPEPEQAPASQLLLGPQGPGLLKGAPPPTLVLTVTNKNADGPGLPTGSPQQPLSQPGSPAPGAPAHMDLERPPQPLFGTPTPLLKKEPPGYEEAVNQQPKQQENGSSSQHMDDLFDILIQSGGKGQARGPSVRSLSAA